jgi:hypothetical protein
MDFLYDTQVNIFFVLCFCLRQFLEASPRRSVIHYRDKTNVLISSLFAAKCFAAIGEALSSPHRDKEVPNKLATRKLFSGHWSRLRQATESNNNNNNNKSVASVPERTIPTE